VSKIKIQLIEAKMSHFLRKISVKLRAGLSNFSTIDENPNARGSDPIL
jgi:hypothetical protein